MHAELITCMLAKVQKIYVHDSLTATLKDLILQKMPGCQTSTVRRE